MDFFHEYLFPPHPHNQFVLSTPTYLRLRCYSRPVSHQHYRLFQHHISRRLREPVYLVAAPSHTSNSSGRRPAVSVCHGKGGWFCYLAPLVHLQLHRPTVSVHPGGGGKGGGVVTWYPSRTPNFYVSVHSGGEGWCCDQAPLAHPRLFHGFRSAREIQFTPRIPTQMSIVGSLATDSRDPN